jgi:carboxypeptidase-like protein
LKKAILTYSNTLLLMFAGFFASDMQAQTLTDTIGVIQFSGIVVTDENGFIQPLPYVNIHLKSTRMGTYSSNDGFFSLVGRRGEVVVFTSVGYEDVEYLIPDTLTTDRYSVFQIMTKDTILLPETVIYPWPSREHFKLEFLAMDITSGLEERVNANLSDKAMAEMIAFLPTDGDENTDFYLRQQAATYYYEGQIRPQDVFNAFAWAKFIKALKRGDFKKKKK